MEDGWRMIISINESLKINKADSLNGSNFGSNVCNNCHKDSNLLPASLWSASL